MYYGVLGGLKTGARIGLWTGSFVGLQELVEAGVRKVLPEDAQHYKTRWASGTVAGLGLATAAGQICELARPKAHGKNGAAEADVSLPQTDCRDTLLRDGSFWERHWA